MPRGSKELTNARKEEIINACEKLYQTIGFKEITLKEIGKVTSFTRTSIYNYFQTKEEIFLEILKREYELWIAELEKIREENETLSTQQFAKKVATSLEHRKQLLKILSMNMYDIEENSCMESLIAFKASYGKSLQEMNDCIKKFFPKTNEEERKRFIFQFFPFIYGIYPYVFITEKQKEAMEEVKALYNSQSVYEISYQCLIQLLAGLSK